MPINKLKYEIGKFNIMELITDIAKYICDSHTSIFTAMQRIEELGNKGKKLGRANMFLVVCDKNNKLLGTLTDGDIRRGIIKGLNLKSEVQNCMQKISFSGKIGEDEKNKVLLDKISKNSSFLPIIDKNGYVKKVLINRSSNFKLNVLVMAGGFGKRLGKITQNMPKPLLPVNGTPIIENILLNIENNTNFKNIYISTHFLAEKIEKYIKNRGNSENIKFIREKKPLGTAGSIQNIEDREQNHLLVVNGDLVINLNFSALANFHFENNFDATIAVARHEVNVPFGVINFDKNGDFEEIKEKPNIINYVSAGINILSPKFQNLVNSGKKIDMPELLSIGRSLNLKIGIFPLHEKWIDLGNIEDLKKINKK